MASMLKFDANKEMRNGAGDVIIVEVSNYRLHRCITLIPLQEFIRKMGSGSIDLSDSKFKKGLVSESCLYQYDFLMQSLQTVAFGTYHAFI